LDYKTVALSQKGIVSEVVGAGLESALTTFPLLSRWGEGVFYSFCTDGIRTHLYPHLKRGEI